MTEHASTHEHLVSRRLNEAVMYPEHQARKASAEYRRVHEHLVDVLDEPCWVCGVRKSTLHDPGHNAHGATQIETHHYHVEWALANAVDPAKVLRDFPELGAADDAHLRRWIDSEGQMLVLCVAPGTPVLMADGSEKPIECVLPGEQVVGHDGASHKVTHAISREHVGDVVVVDGTTVTPEHPFLTPSGWVPAGELAVGQIVYKLGVFDSQVLGLGSVESQILNLVVGAVPVDVVDSFTTSQGSPEMLLHDPSVLHPLAPTAVIPHPDSDVSLRGDHPTTDDRPGSFARVEPSQSARVGAVARPAVARVKPGTAALARPVGESGVRLAAADGTALPRAGGVGVAVRRRDPERVLADKAGGNNTDLVTVGAWSPILEISRVQYSGIVHDISVADCHSYVANGIVVHNCDIHHRSGHYGIHSITYPVWVAQRYFRDSWDLVEGEGT